MRLFGFLKFISNSVLWAHHNEFQWNDPESWRSGGPSFLERAGLPERACHPRCTSTTHTNAHTLSHTLPWRCCLCSNLGGRRPSSMSSRGPPPRMDGGSRMSSRDDYRDRPSSLRRGPPADDMGPPMKRMRDGPPRDGPPMRGPPRGPPRGRGGPRGGPPRRHWDAEEICVVTSLLWLPVCEICRNGP